jgi:protein-disulfide isomerase
MRRAGLALATTTALAMLAVAARAAVPASEPGDLVLGGAKAPVTVVEYASVGCPHCAEWANTVFPEFDKRFIETGRARFVVRVMLTGEQSVATAGFMLVRCADPAKSFQVMDDIYRRQASMFQPGASPGPILEDIARTAGLDDAQFKACITSQAGLDQVNALNARHVDEDGVDLTPTFFVGDRKFEGGVSLDELGKAIKAARGGS